MGKLGEEMNLALHYFTKLLNPLHWSLWKLLENRSLYCLSWFASEVPFMRLK